MRTSLPRGNRKISEPVPGADPGTAPGRPEAVAGDARAGEVGPAHSSGEVGEQGGVRRRGADGAKGRDRGEGGTAKHGPDPEPGSRVPGAGPPTASGREEREGEAHGAAAPCRPRHLTLGLPRAEEGRGAGSRSPDLGGVRGRPGDPARRSPRPSPPRRLPGAAVPATVHTEAGRRATAARHRGAGGQGRPDRGGGHPDAGLRGGVPRLQLRVPARARPARRAGRARRRDRQEADQLDPRRRHPVVLRHDQPRLAGPVRRAPDRRPQDHPPAPEVAAGGRARGRPGGRDGGGDPARGVGEPAARQHLPPLRLRPLGRAVAATPRDRRHDRRALRRRPDRRLRAGGTRSGSSPTSESGWPGSGSDCTRRRRG